MVEEAYKTPNSLHQKRKVPISHNNQNIKYTKERNNIKICKGKEGQVAYKDRPTRITFYFLM